MIRVRASQIFTHSMEDVVAAKKQLDSGTPFEEVVTNFSTCPSRENAGVWDGCQKEIYSLLGGKKFLKPI